MNQVKAVIFDIDGTLLDSVDQHAASWVDAFREFGHQLEFAAVRSQIGKGGDQLLPVFLSEKEIEDQGEALTKRRSQIFHERYLEQVKPFPGSRELFERVKAAGQKPAVASSAKGEDLKTFLWIAGVDDLVETGTSSADAEKSKPHPDIFEAALEKLGPEVNPANAIVVGDTPYDAQAAAKAGMKTVGVLCGGFPEEDLRAAGCIAIYRDPEHLATEYDQSPLVGGSENPGQQSQRGE